MVANSSVVKFHFSSYKMIMLQACCTQSAATGITSSYLPPQLSTIPSKDEYVPATEQRTPVIMMATHATICIDNDRINFDNDYKF